MTEKLVIEGWECDVGDDGVREAYGPGDDYVEGWSNRVCVHRPRKSSPFVPVPRAVMLWLLGLEAERHEQAPQGAPDELAELVENTCPPEEARARVARAKRELGQAPQGAPRGLSDDWTDEQRQTFFATVRGACTCPRVGPNAPTVGFYRRPAIVIGHQPRCPALEVIWSRDRD